MHTHTHTHTHTHRERERERNNRYVKKQIKRKSVPSSLPKKKKHHYNTPDGGLHGNSQGMGAVNCCEKELHPRDCRYTRFYSILYKCNLTKS